MLKNKWLTVIALMLLSLCVMIFGGCTLEGSLETLRKQVEGEQYKGNVTATAISSSSIRVSWNPVPGATSYNVYRQTASSGGTWETAGYSNSTSYTDTGLSANTTYYYLIYTQDSYRIGSASATTWSSGSGGGVPNAPTGVTASAASSSSITVSWSSVSGAASYDIYRNTDTYSTYSYVGNVYSTSYTDYGLSPSTTYYYKIVAYNNYGASSPSAYASATTSSSSGGYGSDPIDLTSLTWYDNSLSAGAVHQYRFYATSGNSYSILWDDVDNSSKSADIKVGVKMQGSSSYIVEPTDTGTSSLQNNIVIHLTTSGYYIIEVQGLSSNSSGSYSVLYQYN